MTTLATYVLAIGGFIAMAGFAIAAFQNNLKYPQAKLMLINMLRTNPRQAEALCAQMPRTFLEAVGMVFKACVMAGSSDPAIVKQCSVPTFDGGVAVVGAWWNALMMKVKMGAGAAGAAIALAISSDKFPPIIVLICAILAGLLALYCLYRKTEVTRSMMLARAEVLPEVEAVFIQGRYR